MSGHPDSNRSVGTDNTVVELRDGAGWVEPKKCADRVALLVVHIARDKAALAINLAVVHADPGLAGVWIGELATAAAQEIEHIEAVPERDDRAAPLTQGERADILWHVPSAGCAPVGFAGMDLGAEAVDPVEALLGDVP
jgi:hypothetical protein